MDLNLCVFAAMVAILKIKFGDSMKKIKKKIKTEFLESSTISPIPEGIYDPRSLSREDDRLFVCENCFSTMSKKNKVPPISIMNGTSGSCR